MDEANDWYTHVGLVEYVEEAGTISVLSYIDGEVSRLIMNLDNPSDLEVDGVAHNTRLREPSDDDPPYSEYLAGELFAGFASLLGNRTEVVVLDSWDPGMSTTLTASR